MNVILNGRSLSTKCRNNHTYRFNNGDQVIDEIRGYLVFVKNNWVLMSVAQFNCYYTKLKVEKLALILESPHKDEFSGNYVPLRPANGLTGRKINNKIGNFALSWNLSTTVAYEVMLMNAVQFQCSCWYQCASSGHHPLKRHEKDSVFRVLFDDSMGNLRQDFIKRLKAYSPSIVINACTSPLRDTKVKTAISEAGFNCSQSVKHPSVW